MPQFNIRNRFYREEHPHFMAHLLALAEARESTAAINFNTVNARTCEMCFRVSSHANPVMHLIRVPYPGRPETAVYGYICIECVRGPTPVCEGCGLGTLGSYVEPSTNRRLAWPTCGACYDHAGECPECRRYYCVPPGETECRNCSRTTAVPKRVCPHCFHANKGTLLACTRCHAELLDGDTLTFTRVPIHRPIGVELEMCCINTTDVFAPYGKLGSDGSVDTIGTHYYPVKPEVPLSGFVPYELRLDPEVGDRWARNLRIVTRHLIDTFQAFTNNTCGTHVHIYAGDLKADQIENVMNWWRVHEFMFYRLVPSYRQRSNFAKRVSGTADYVWRGDRYYALNVSALQKYKTLEFRLHHGTLDAERIIDWANVALHTVDRLKDLPITYEQAMKLSRSAKRGLLTRFVKDTGLPRETVEYIVNTARLYWTGRCGLLRGGDPNDDVGKVLTPLTETEEANV